VQGSNDVCEPGPAVELVSVPAAFGRVIDVAVCDDVVSSPHPMSSTASAAAAAKPAVGRKTLCSLPLIR
jgi:hypothetical protein